MKKDVPAGNLVFYRKAKNEPNGGSKNEIEFNGHGFGVHLGSLPYFFGSPTKDSVRAALGGIGFVLIDEIEEFLGKDARKIFIEQWIEKYELILNGNEKK